MSLIAALNIGKSALSTQQAAIQVTGNNIANAGNGDYTRQTTQVSSNAEQQVRPGMFVGTGVNLIAVQRQIDEALQGRLRGSISGNEAADVSQQWLSRIEAIFNELGDEDLSTQLSKFFNSWSNLANNPQDIGLRQVVIQNGQTVATWFQNIRNDLSNLQKDIDARLGSLAWSADQMAQQVADLNGQIVVAEGGGPGQANGLRDQRDAVLSQLAQLLPIKTVMQPNGIIDVYIASQPLVVGTQNRGVALRQTSSEGKLISEIIFKANNGVMDLQGGGQLGAMSVVRSQQISATIDVMDGLAGKLIYELNNVYASGQGLDGFSMLTGSNALSDVDVPLNDSESGLAFTPVNGSFVVHVRQKATGLVSSTLVQVDLDGLNDDDTTLSSLMASLDGIDGISATIAGGKLRLSADSDAVDMSFSQDSSGALAALGLNCFFVGTNAQNMAVNSILVNQPRLLAAARNGQSGDNQTALAIAALESTPIESLSGSTLKDYYQQTIDSIAVWASGARTNAEATRVVKETLLAQREGLSGVSLDEEAVNLIRQQRAFQAAARLIAAIDELMKTVLQLV